MGVFSELLLNHEETNMNLDKITALINLIATLACGVVALIQLFVFNNWGAAIINAGLAILNAWLFNLNGGFAVISEKVKKNVL